nr:bidirectional sugar transporter SWEET3b [Hemerocallis fulva]
MGSSLRFPVGILGNAASLFLYTAPILTFARVIRKGSTEEFSCIPYIIALLNCLLYTWFGLPVVSKGWENFTVATINGLGILLEISFILIYIWFASAKRKKLVIPMVVAVIVVFGITAFVSSAVFHDHPHRKVFVGSVGLVASVAMYGSPLVAMRLVIKTKSVEFMPFYLSFFSFLASSLWMLYGLLGQELFIAAPNFLGTPMGILQLILYCMYKNKKGAHEEQRNIDIEKNGEKLNS